MQIDMNIHGWEVPTYYLIRKTCFIILCRQIMLSDILILITQIIKGTEKKKKGKKGIYFGRRTLRLIISIT